jgi:hypothetical protein
VEDKKPTTESDDANDPKTAPVDGPGGDEDEGGLGATSQGSPGEAEGGEAEGGEAEGGEAEGGGTSGA